jgi:hypothetical protein
MLPMMRILVARLVSRLGGDSVSPASSTTNDWDPIWNADAPRITVIHDRNPKENTILDTGVEYGKMKIMNTARKITVEVPEELLERAQEASGEGITQTVRTGLQLVAASRTYARLRELRGKVRFSRTATDLKDDR